MDIYAGVQMEDLSIQAAVFGHPPKRVSDSSVESHRDNLMNYRSRITTDDFLEPRPHIILGVKIAEDGI